MTTYSSNDSFMASLIWGRIGAAVLALAAFVVGAFGYTFSPEDQTQVYEIVTAILAGLAGAWAAVSKIRESKRAEK